MRVALCYNKKPDINKEPYCEYNSNQSYHEIFQERYAEFDDEYTIKSIANAIEKFHNVYLVEADENAYDKFLKIRPDIVFNISEGLKGPYREAFIPSILEFLKIPYTGSSPLTLSICLNKSLTKEILDYHCIPTPRFQLINSINDVDLVSKRWKYYPCIIKPVHEGSSIGIRNDSIIGEPKQLSERIEKMIHKYQQPIIIERFLLGREFTIGVLGNSSNADILPPIEIRFEQLPIFANPIYSFEAKWIWDVPDKPLDIFKCPAEIDERLYKRVRKTVLTAYKVLGCQDWARIDVRLDENGEPNILEVNPLPGVLPDPEDNSCMPKAARLAGLSYDDLILKVLDIACERCGLRSEKKLVPLIKR